MKKVILNIGLGLIILGLFHSCWKNEPPVKPLEISGTTMGTTYSIKWMPVNAVDEGSLKVKVDAILESVNDSMSTYRPQSEISKFNQDVSLQRVSISKDFSTVLGFALKLAKITRGYYDPTIGPLVNLWGFGPAARREVPSQEKINELLQYVGRRHLEFDRGRRTLRKRHPKVYLDLSSLAKGYGVDLVSQHLLDIGVQNFLVEIGGEMRASGQKASGPWKIGVEAPQKGARILDQVYPLNNLAVATSGDYRNFFEKDNKNYSHAIDPSTGSPIRRPLSSVSVFMPSCMMADAWATALMILGPKEGLALANKHKISAYFVYRDEDDHGSLRKDYSSTFKASVLSETN